MVVDILPHIKPSDERYGATYQDRAKSIREYIAEVYDQMCDRYDNMSNPYFHVAFWKGYMYKDIRIEWQVMRDAWKNRFYQEWERKTPRDGAVVVIGSLYGALPYALALTGKRRRVTGVVTNRDEWDFVRHLQLKNNNLEWHYAEQTDDYPLPEGAYVIRMAEEKTS